MSGYIEQSKAVVLDYLSKAQLTERKIAEGRKIYQPDSMEQEEKRLRSELSKARADAETQLDGIYERASREARSWGNLDGNKLTPDAQLLSNQGVTPEQFDDLVNRYQDNYTMLDALRKYGERMNAEELEKRRAAGDPLNLSVSYNVSSIPSADYKLREWRNMRDKAGHFLNVADGNGFDSDFARDFARAAADKDFEAWGSESTPPETQNHDATVNAFCEAWGFKNAL